MRKATITNNKAKNPHSVADLKVDEWIIFFLSISKFQYLYIQPYPFQTVDNTIIIAIISIMIAQNNVLPLVMPSATNFELNKNYAIIIICWQNWLLSLRCAVQILSFVGFSMGISHDIANFVGILWRNLLKLN